MWVPVAFSAVLLVWLLPSLWLRLPRLTLLDLFLLAIAMFLGGYTILDAVSGPEGRPDAIVAGITFALILWPTFIIWWIARRPSKLLQLTSLTRLREDCIACPTWPVIALVAISLLYRWATASVFSGFGEIVGNDLERLEQNLPYWYTSLGIFSTAGTFPAAMCSWYKWRASRGLQKLFWLGMLALGALFILGMGRRAVFALLVIIGWDLLTESRARRRTWRVLVTIALFAPVMLMVSNIYQAYRWASVRGVPLENVTTEVKGDSIFESALEVDRTASNLKEREAMWRYNYNVIKAWSEGNGELQWGRLFIGGIQNYIPAALYPGKTLFWAEEEIDLIFKLPLYDKPENIFVNTFADFGFLSLAVAPALILAFVYGIALALRYMRDPFLHVLLMGAAIFYAMNTEAAYLTPLGMAREFAICALVYVAVRVLLSSGRTLIRTAAAPH